MHTPSPERGFTLVELLVSLTITLLVTGAALTTFSNALTVNDSAAQLSDANQNLRAGTNQLIRDLMQAGRIIGPEGIPLPTGAGVQAFSRPGPVAGLTFNLVVDDDTTLNLPSITTGYQLGPTINGSRTDIVTIMTVDEFMPVLQTPPTVPATPTAVEGTIAPDGRSVTLPTTSLWITGDTTNDTPPIQKGDLVLFKNPKGMAMVTVTSTDSTHIYFGANDPIDWFHFNQFSVPQVPIVLIKQVADTTTAWTQRTTMFRALMITYYVDNTTTPEAPRLVRQLNHCPAATPDCLLFEPQALAGIVEDLDLTYDLVDGVNNPTNVTSLPFTGSGVTYNSNQIRKVNVHIGVRSEVVSKPAQDYIRNHLSTSVDVRSLASVDRYANQ
ncbi:MAG: prepilin-type N-terminal cleavage/methylation domain-containing protein [Acidobacteriota bacterium]